MKVCVDDTTGAMRVKGGLPCGEDETKRLIPKGKRINADTLDKMHAVEFLDKATYDTDNDGLADGGVGVVERLGFSRTTLDSTGDVGIYNSITIGADGLGLISYYDAINGDLKVARCSNSCWVWSYSRSRR